MLDRIKSFHDALVDLGVARSVVSAPASRLLSPELHISEDHSGVTIYSNSVIEPEIVAVSRDLFASGHFNLAVFQAFLAVEKYVALRSGLSQSGTTLMDQAFSPSKPRLAWSERQTTSQKDEQKGYHQIYSGAMSGIRNPVTHEINWVDDAQHALELLIIAQHLLRRAKQAKNVP